MCYLDALDAFCTLRAAVDPLPEDPEQSPTIKSVTHADRKTQPQSCRTVAQHYKKKGTMIQLQIRREVTS
jgi:hypothetical protein